MAATRRIVAQFRRGAKRNLKFVLIKGNERMVGGS